jgi:hypothetical protein
MHSNHTLSLEVVIVLFFKLFDHSLYLLILKISIYFVMIYFIVKK